MITYITGDIFNSPAKVLVNPVNTDGVMGKGLAKQFKTYFPSMFKEYQKHCESGQLTVGKLWLFRTENKWILNFPTKTTWRKKSELSYIEAGLKKFVESYNRLGLTTVAFPKLGCGNGELDWENQVKPLMEKYLKTIPISVFIYTAANEENSPEHKNPQDMEIWLRTQPAYLSWQELLNDIRQIIVINNSGVCTNAITQKKFNVDLTEEFLEISNETDNYKLDLNDFHSLWDHIRDAGYFNKQIALPPVADCYSYVLSIFLLLPYCERASISDASKSLNEKDSLGCVLVPPSARNSEKSNIESVG